MLNCYICTWSFQPHRHTASRQRTCGEERCARQHKRNYAKGKKSPKSLIPADLEAVRSAWAWSTERMAAFYLMSQSGLRVNELVQIQIEDFLRPDGGLRDTFTLTAERTKTNTDREVLVLDQGLDAVSAHLEATGRTTGWLFPGRRGGHLHKRTVQRWFDNIKPLLSEHHSTHHLRHTAISAAADTDLRLGQMVGGHQDLGTTQIYCGLRPKDARDKLNQATDYLGV